MERGESSRMAYRRGLSRKGVFLCFEDEESEATWDMVTTRRRTRAPRKIDCKIWIFGSENEGFEGLLNKGWLAERRVLTCNKRVYTYYYDRLGRQYAKLKHAKEAMRLETAREQGLIQGEPHQQVVRINHRGGVPQDGVRVLRRYACRRSGVPRDGVRMLRRYAFRVCKKLWHNHRTCPNRTSN